MRLCPEFSITIFKKVKKGEKVKKRPQKLSFIFTFQKLIDNNFNQIYFLFGKAIYLFFFLFVKVKVSLTKSPQTFAKICAKSI